MRKLLAAVSLSALCALTGCAAASSSAAKPVQSSTAPATPSTAPVTSAAFQQGENLYFASACNYTEGYLSGGGGNECASYQPVPSDPAQWCVNAIDGNGVNPWTQDAQNGCLWAVRYTVTHPDGGIGGA